MLVEPRDQHSRDVCTPTEDDSLQDLAKGDANLKTCVALTTQLWNKADGGSAVLGGVRSRVTMTSCGRAGQGRVGYGRVW